MTSDYKKYADTAKRGIIGESFFESLIVSHAIPHRVARQNDLGVDFFCEWVHGDHPTGILFAAQIKSTSDKVAKVTHIGKSRLNLLEQFNIGGVDFGINATTVAYWKGLGLPTFLFAMIETHSSALKHSSTVNCYYKRLTPLLDGRTSPDDESPGKMFFKANEGAIFHAFADPNRELGGFARDLLIDYVRLSYHKGHIIQLQPHKLGFWPFPKKPSAPDAVVCFPEIIRWHEENIREMRDWANDVLSQIGSPP